MKKISLLIFVIFLFCQTNAQNIVSSRPTYPSKHEVKRQSCPPGYTWQGEEWKWDKETETYNWVPGKCLRIKRGHIWLPGQWSRIARGWTWTPGEWRKI
jgi:hypothetical protein